MKNDSIYKKNDRVWVRTSLKGVPGQIRPAIVISVVIDHYLYQPEDFILVRFDDDAYPPNDFECLPASRIMGLRETFRNDTHATGNNDYETNNPDNHEQQQEP